MFIESLIIGIHLSSVHVPQRGHNNFNPGLYVQTESGWIAGGFRNSLRRGSVYFGKSFETQLSPSFVGGVTLGGVTGYKDRGDRMNCWRDDSGQKWCQVIEDRGFAKHAVAPFVAAYVKLAPIKLSLLPPVGKHSAVLHVSVEHKF